MNQTEEWRTVPSAPFVEASSHGRIRTKPKQVPMPNGGFKTTGGLSRYGVWDGKRYLYVLNGKSYKVARLICEAFNGQPKPGQVCMHLDENSRNNRPENLRWGTQKENLNAPGFLKYCHSRLGDKSPHAISIKRKMAAQAL